jgi:oligopeptide transport system permease protein
MVKILAKKALILLFSLLIVTTLTFILMHSIPGDPFTEEKAMPKEILDAMYHHYGLDAPWHIQYLKFLKGLLTFDLGPSFKYQGRSVTDIIKEGFPVSFALGCQAISLSLFLGIGIGSLAALNYLRWPDSVAMVIVILGISVPSFILATVLQYLFSMKLDLFPVARWGTLAHSILPSISLAALPIAFIARLTRAGMIEILQQDYILTARSKGLSQMQIILRHALRNTLLPIMTYLGPLVTAVFTGSFAVEKIFGIPGLGQWFVTSISNRDYTVIMGTTVFYSAMLMITVFLVDLLYCLIDPRIKIESRPYDSK